MAQPLPFQPATLPNLRIPAYVQLSQSSPDSIFTQKRLATISRPDGRITLSDMRLITTRETGLRGSGEREERTLSSEAEVNQVLLEVFGIDVSR
jgi:N-hydroxyarylamine O-acetyltransferase